MNRTTGAALAATIVLILLAYSNHFQNSFHFDDDHTIVDNPYIRSLHNLPRFFTDVTTFSVLPSNRTYRPLVSASLALDYWFGGGLWPAYFHASTIVWFLVQFVLMVALFLKLCGNRWIALFAAGLYAVHPAIAETVNYVIQRGDIYSTLGVIAGLVLYAWRPPWRRFGLYLVPVVAALLSKPPAMVFPALLFLYIWFFERETLRKVILRCIPALVITGIMAAITVAMTPSTYAPGAASALAYRITQPLVAMRYFLAFFAPLHLSADTDLRPASGLPEENAWLGFVFLIVIVFFAWWCSQREAWKPTAFGLWWFIIVLIPTAIFPLAEVENDHRMYFPFVGLSLAVCWPIGSWLIRKQRLGAAIAVFILCIAAWGTHRRNNVWRTDESLWYDVTVKSPTNGRGLMNYGLTQMAKGDFESARSYFQKGLVYTPNYSLLYLNLGIADGATHRDAEAEADFNKALALAPNQAEGHFFYGRWLAENRRWSEAIEQLRSAVTANPDRLDAWYLLMNIESSLASWKDLQSDAQQLLQRFPTDAAATQYLAAAKSPPAPKTAVDYLNLSLSLNRDGDFPGSIAAAQTALKLQPDFAEAYNNIAAAYEAMKMWDPAIEAARQALRIKPDFQLAKNNLAWSEDQKARAKR